MTKEGSKAAARAGDRDVSKTTPAASTTGRRGSRNYREYTSRKIRSPWKPPRVGDRIPLALVGGVGQQRNVPRALERNRETSLVARAGAGHAAGQNLAPLADEAAQTRDLFVIDEVDLLHTEVADLLVRLAIPLFSRWWHVVLSG